MFCRKEMMKYFLTLIISVLLVGCNTTQSNLKKLDNKVVVNNGQDLIKLNNQICSSFKSEDKTLYSCGSGYSSDFELSKKKSLLDGKTKLQDKISTMVVKSEIQNVEEDTKTGVKKKYSSEEQSSFGESYINGYQIVFDKTFLYKSNYYSFVVIKYQLS